MIEMIQFLFDHSYEDDYYQLSNITVKLKDPVEKERIKQLVNEHKLIGMQEYPNRHLKERLAKLLKVDVKLIDFDTEEIDMM